VERTALMKKLKAQCGAGGKVAGDVVEIQGDHAAKIVQLLVQAGYTNTKKSGGK
jgi:translation initiation factor 1